MNQCIGGRGAATGVALWEVDSVAKIGRWKDGGIVP